MVATSARLAAGAAGAGVGVGDGVWAEVVIVSVTQITNNSIAGQAILSSFFIQVISGSTRFVLVILLSRENLITNSREKNCVNFAAGLCVLVVRFSNLGSFSCVTCSSTRLAQVLGEC